MLFDGTDDGLFDTVTGHLAIKAGGGVITVTGVLLPQTGKSSATGLIHGEVATAATATSPQISPLAISGTTSPIKPMAYARADDGSTPINMIISQVDGSLAIGLRWTMSDGSTVRQDYDTTARTSASTSQLISDVAITVNQRHLGGYSTILYKGYMSEIVTWGSALTDAQVAAGKTNQRSYYGIT